MFLEIWSSQFRAPAWRESPEKGSPAGKMRANVETTEKLQWQLHATTTTLPLVQVQCNNNSQQHVTQMWESLPQQ